MNAVARFKQFFMREGVSFFVHRNTSTPLGHPEVPSALRITVGQSHFHFDAAGRFLGVEWDEMGDWEPADLEPGRR